MNKHKRASEGQENKMRAGKEVRAQTTAVKSQGGNKKNSFREGGIYSVYQQTLKVYSVQLYKAQSCKSTGTVQKQ